MIKGKKMTNFEKVLTNLNFCAILSWKKHNRGAVAMINTERD